MSIYRKYDILFTTATILNWLKLLKPTKYKEEIINSLKFLSDNNKVDVYAFVIMDNHIHILWNIKHPYKLNEIQRDFLRYTAQQIKFDLQKKHPLVLEKFKVDASDRTYQFWERNPLSTLIENESVLIQKLDYIHNNPLRKGLCNSASEYYFSSAAFYETGIDHFGFLKQYNE